MVGLSAQSTRLRVRFGSSVVGCGTTCEPSRMNTSSAKQFTLKPGLSGFESGLAGSYLALHRRASGAASATEGNSNVSSEAAAVRLRMVRILRRCEQHQRADRKRETFSWALATACSSASDSMASRMGGRNWVRGRSTEASPETTITMPRGGRLITSWTAQLVSTSVPDVAVGQPGDAAVHHVAGAGVDGQRADHRQPGGRRAGCRSGRCASAAAAAAGPARSGRRWPPPPPPAARCGRRLGPGGALPGWSAPPAAGRPPAVSPTGDRAAPVAARCGCARSPDRPGCSLTSVRRAYRRT